MLKVKVKNGKIEHALKKLKRKVGKTKQNKQIRERQQFTKKSVKRRQEVLKAIHKQKKREEDEY